MSLFPKHGDNFDLVEIGDRIPVETGTPIPAARWLERFVLELRALLDPDMSVDFHSSKALLSEFDEYRAEERRKGRE